MLATISRGRQLPRLLHILPLSFVFALQPAVVEITPDLQERILREFEDILEVGASCFWVHPETGGDVIDDRNPRDTEFRESMFRPEATDGNLQPPSNNDDNHPWRWLKIPFHRREGLKFEVSCTADGGCWFTRL